MNYSNPQRYKNGDRIELQESSTFVVESEVMNKTATANATFSGWKRPGVLARASQYVGFGTARAYWDCR